MRRHLVVPPRARLVVFAQSQAPVLAIFALVGVASVLLDVAPRVPALALSGYALVALATVAALLLPWERWPWERHAVLAAVDLLGAVLISASTDDHLQSISALAAFPGVWLSAAGRRAGMYLALVGVYAATFAPALNADSVISPSGWLGMFLSATVLPAVVVTARVLVENNRHVRGLLAESRSRWAESQVELERLGAVLQNYADKADIALVVFDQGGRVVTSNARCCEIADLARYDRGTDYAEHVYADDQITPIPGPEQPLYRARNGESIDSELYWVGEPGHQTALITTAKPLFASDGTSIGVMLLSHDITPQVRAGREREDALATLSHELRTPLNAIIGYTDMLAADPLPESSLARVAVVSRNAERVLKLATSFLDGLHTLDSLQPETLDLGEIVAHAVDPASIPILRDRTVGVDVPPGTRVRADQEGLAAILSNLISNAAKFSSEGDRIDIVAAPRGASIEITVSNTGSRIDPADRERIFDRFYRSPDARESAVPGTGIGLAFSRKLATALGGSLVAGSPPEGAAVILTLPAATAVRTLTP